MSLFIEKVSCFFSFGLGFEFPEDAGIDFSTASSLLDNLTIKRVDEMLIA
jgi:hypothetical protein